MDNANSYEYLEKIKNQVIENLKRTTFAPSVQMTDVPRDPAGMDDEADAMLDDLDEDENKDSRFTKRRWDKYTEKDGELSESEDEAENETNGVRQQPRGRKKRRNMMDFQNPNAVPDDEEIMEADGTQAKTPSQEGDEADQADQAGAPITSATNGSAHSAASNADESAGSSPKSIPTSPPAHQVEAPDPGEDTEMGDANDAEPSGQGHGATDVPRPQEATPPDSPPTTSNIATLAVTAEPAQDTASAEDVGNDAMDEGDTLDDPALEKEAGEEERNREDIDAETATKVTERKEEG